MSGMATKRRARATALRAATPSGALVLSAAVGNADIVSQRP